MIKWGSLLVGREEGVAQVMGGLMSCELNQQIILLIYEQYVIVSLFNSFSKVYPQMNAYNAQLFQILKNSIGFMELTFCFKTCCL